MLHQRTLCSLETRFGDQLSLAPAVLEQHGRGESYHRTLPPDAVVFARSTAEVADVLTLCHATRTPVVAFGAGTSLEGNVSAVEGGVCIDLSQMNGILRIDVEDMDCTVEAGVTRSRLNGELRHSGLFFPLDPGADASIGGMAATRASGTNAVRYGTMRDSVLALTVVLADGTIINTGSRARKSAAGYDLTRLFVGSEGPLGVLTEVTLRLQSVPEAVAAAVCGFPDVASAIRTVVALLQSGVPVARVELLDRAQIRAVNRYSKTTYPVADTLFFEFHGGPKSIAEQVTYAEALALECGGEGFISADEPESRNRLWKARHDAYYATIALRPGARGWSTDVCVPISNLGACIAGAQSLIASTTTPATVVGHVGDGNFHVIFAVDPENVAELAEIARISDSLALLAQSFGGTCTGEHGVGSGKIAHMRAEHGAALNVMAAIKAALDPRGILNPGKVLPPAPLALLAGAHDK